MLRDRGLYGPHEAALIGRNLEDFWRLELDFARLLDAPVVLFSHGLGGSREGYGYLGSYWAAHGYVAVHLQHIGSDETMLAAMSEQWLPSLMRWREDGYLRSELKMDDVLLWITLYMHTSLGKSFITMSYGVIDVERREMTFARQVIAWIEDEIERHFKDVLHFTRIEL